MGGTTGHNHYFFTPHSSCHSVTQHVPPHCARTWTLVLALCTRSMYAVMAIKVQHSNKGVTTVIHATTI
eukprot:264735-Pelagomonas_calceolata.AAC.3